MSLDIGNKFYHKLLNRNELQGDGKYTAIEFREKFLNDLDDKSWWDDDSKLIELDFKNVEVMGPSWTNEIFAYYLSQGIKIAEIQRKIRCLNLTKTKEITIQKELKQGYKGYGK